MRIVLINLQRAAERRARMAREFEAAGLEYEIMPAIDGRRLSREHLAVVDWRARRQLGGRPHHAASIACWLSHRQAMRDLAVHGPDLMAVFEDDARLKPSLPAVLRALGSKPFAFDVVSFYRGHPRRRFVPCAPLTAGVTAGRVRYSEVGLVGYVITREAARHFLDTVPRMVLAVDHALLRYWTNGLNVFHVDPPLVHHGGNDDSQIRAGYDAARELQRRTENPAAILWRRSTAGIRRSVRKRLAFRRLLRGRIGVTCWPEARAGAASHRPVGTGAICDRVTGAPHHERVESRERSSRAGHWDNPLDGRRSCGPHHSSGCSRDRTVTCAPPS